VIIAITIYSDMALEVTTEFFFVLGHEIGPPMTVVITAEMLFLL
jgi:hypothetical protein